MNEMNVVEAVELYGSAEPGHGLRALMAALIERDIDEAVENKVEVGDVTVWRGYLAMYPLRALIMLKSERSGDEMWSIVDELEKLISSPRMGNDAPALYSGHAATIYPHLWQHDMPISLLVKAWQQDARRTLHSLQAGFTNGFSEEEVCALSNEVLTSFQPSWVRDSGVTSFAQANSLASYLKYERVARYKYAEGLRTLARAGVRSMSEAKRLKRDTGVQGRTWGNVLTVAHQAQVHQ